jgi:hypothetical protein
MLQTRIYGKYVHSQQVFYVTLRSLLTQIAPTACIRACSANRQPSS